jgi:hypothetical protein
VTPEEGGGAPVYVSDAACVQPDTSEYITAVSPESMLESTLTSLSFTGATASSDSYIGFVVDSGGCGSPSFTFQYSSAPTAMSIGVVDTYVLCYSIDGGVTYTEQSIYGDAFAVTGDFSDDITAVSLPSVAVNSATSLVFTGAVAAGTTYIGFAADSGGCGSPSWTFQYATAPASIAQIPTAGTYVVCYSVDSGSSYVEQTSFGDAFVVRCAAGQKGSGCSEEATTLDIEDDNGVIFFGDDDSVALSAEAGSLTLNADLNADTVTVTTATINGVDLYAKLIELQNRVAALQNGG